MVSNDKNEILKNNSTTSNYRFKSKSFAEAASQSTQSTDIISINGYVKDWVISDVSQSQSEVYLKIKQLQAKQMDQQQQILREIDEKLKQNKSEKQRKSFLNQSQQFFSSFKSLINRSRKNESLGEEEFSKEFKQSWKKDKRSQRLQNLSFSQQEQLINLNDSGFQSTQRMLNKSNHEMKVFLSSSSFLIPPEIQSIDMKQEKTQKIRPLTNNSYVETSNQSQKLDNALENKTLKSKTMLESQKKKLNNKFTFRSNDWHLDKDLLEVNLEEFELEDDGYLEQIEEEQKKLDTQHDFRGAKYQYTGEPDNDLFNLNLRPSNQKQQKENASQDKNNSTKYHDENIKNPLSSNQDYQGRKILRDNLIKFDEECPNGEDNQELVLSFREPTEGLSPRENYLDNHLQNIMSQSKQNIQYDQDLSSDDEDSSRKQTLLSQQRNQNGWM
ncbi:UNKNOWN [Stylonychia lemnae]|uniref:Uncharacterized protein n=1 Tax=Stylonychia lemnae TaxID=5949 RepID=A0A078B0J1_STYLE|nr:UNKNOWN [Stylonychia lemnae]|eukprot:CDW88049.1 UNKNOWN [Stylonychia lemnae]